MNSIASLLDGHTTYAFVWTMVHSLWQCGLVAVVLAITLYINRNHSAHLRYLMGIAALLICVAISIATFSHLYSSIQLADAAMHRANTSVFLSYPGSFFEHFYQLLNSHIGTIMLVWVLGFCIQAYCYLRDFIYALALKSQNCEPVQPQWAERCQQLAQQLNIHKAVQLKNSVRIGSICVIGHFKPVILLPIGLLTSLTNEQVEALLLHELAHIRRNDYLVNAIQSLVRLLYFFNPAVLWVSKMIDVEREHACDDIAVEHCGSAKLYANSLASISELELRLATVLAARSSRFKMLPRITRLFSKGTGVSRSMEQLTSALCALGVILAMNVSAAEIDIAAPVNDIADISAQLTALPPALAPALPPAAIASVAKPSPPAASKTLAVKPVPENCTKKATAIEPKMVTVTAAAIPSTILATPSIDYAIKRKALALPVQAKPLQLADAGTSQTPPPAVPATARQMPLEKVGSLEFDELYVSNRMSLPITHKIYLSDVPVEFADVWNSKHGTDTSHYYREQVKREYGATLKRTLTEALTKVGWEVVATPQKDALNLNARLHTLFISAPETTGLKHSIVAQVGQSGIELIFSNPQQQPIMKIVDYRATKDSSASPTVANRATNRRYFRILMESWSEDAAEYLQNLMNFAESQQGQ